MPIDKSNRNNDRFTRSLSKSARITIILLSVFLFVLSIFLPMLISTYSIPNIVTTREYKAGEISDETIYSPMDFSYVDTIATEELRQLAIASVLPVFSYSISNSAEIRNMANDFVSLFYANPSISVDEFKQKYNIEDADGVFERLFEMSPRDRVVLARLIYEGTINICNKGIVSNSDVERVKKEGYDKVILESFDEKFQFSKTDINIDSFLTREDIPTYILSWVSSVEPDIPSSSVDLIVDGIELLVSENVIYDEIFSSMQKESVSSKVQPVIVEVKKGDEILSVDKIITDRMLRTIDKINDEASIKMSLVETVGKIFYLATIISLFLYLFPNIIQYKYRVVTYTSIVLVLVIAVFIVEFLLITYLVDYGIMEIDAWIPFILVPLIISSITNKKYAGVMAGMFFAALQNVWPTSNIYTFFYITTCCIISNYLLHFNDVRIGVLIQSLISACFVSVITLLFSLIEQLDLRAILISTLGSALNVILAHLMLAILLPILEKLFNIPTGYRLHELSYADTPTLNRLNQVALGTYNHSKNVSDMAYVAAKAIGANAELARVGALYHDIGKSEHPEYFVENQTGKNAHDDISASLSVAIIKSHLKIGIEKAKDIGLPPEVIDIIGEHHGNDLIKYFYNEAMKNSNSNVSEEDFRYSGRIPSTPESAIVMLADCVEAATRTIKNPNHQKYEKFISNIISDKINHKQLNDSQLTLTDLDKIKQTFIHQLMGRDHHRIEYDNDK